MSLLGLNLEDVQVSAFNTLNGLRTNKAAASGKKPHKPDTGVEDTGAQLEQDVEAARQLLQSGTLDEETAAQLKETILNSEKLLEKHHNPLLKVLRCG